jgi:hypothetical protein
VNLGGLSEIIGPRQADRPPLGAKGERLDVLAALIDA